MDSLPWGPAARPPRAKLIAGCWGEPPLASPSTQHLMCFGIRSKASCGDTQLWGHPAAPCRAAAAGAPAPLAPINGRSPSLALCPCKVPGKRSSGIQHSRTRLRPLQSPALFLEGKSLSVHGDEPAPAVPRQAQGWRMQEGPWRPLTLLRAQDASARDGQNWHP